MESFTLSFQTVCIVTCLIQVFLIPVDFFKVFTTYFYGNCISVCWIEAPKVKIYEIIVCVSVSVCSFVFWLKLDKLTEWDAKHTHCDFIQTGTREIEFFNLIGAGFLNEILSIIARMCERHPSVIGAEHMTFIIPV